MAIARSILIGVFSDTASAENAVETLHNAGFGGDQVRYSGHATAGTSFWDSIRSLFAGTTGNSAENVVNDLMKLGLSQEEASYYAIQHQNGNPIVAVKADDRMPEAAQILQNNGGNSYRAGVATSAASSYGQSTTSNQGTTPADQYGGDTSPQGEQFSQQRDYMQPGRFDQANNLQGDQYNQPVTPQGDRYSKAADTPANQFNQSTDYAQVDQSNQQADYTQPDQYDQPPRMPADQYNQQQASYDQTNEYEHDQPPRMPADQYSQQAYSQGSQHDPDAETEERHQARLREERLRAERQYNQSQAQSQSGVAPTRDTYTDDDRNSR